MGIEHLRAGALKRMAEQLDLTMKPRITVLLDGKKIASLPLDYGVQPAPTTCPQCGAPRTCCGGAKET